MFKTILICSAILAGVAGHAAPPLVDQAVELPTYTVSETPLLPDAEKWDYAKVEGFEILSSATHAETIQILTDLRWFANALRVAWPGLEEAKRVPISVILCGTPSGFENLRPERRGAADSETSFVLGGRNYAAIVIDVGTKVIAVDPDAGNGVAPGMAGYGVEADPTRQLYRAYVHSLFAGATPRYPAWFVEGAAQVLKDVEISPELIVLGRIEDDNLVQIGTSLGTTPVMPIGPREWDRGFVGYLKDKPLLGMTELLRDRAGAVESGDMRNALWSKQAAAFVHWGLFGFGRKYERAMMRFVTRASRGESDEQAFVDCFGFNFRRAEAEIRSYINFTVYSIKEFRAKKGGELPRPAPIALREATEGEIGRIKADALIHAGRVPDARQVLLAAYLRGARDPDLLATFGLIEQRRGDLVRAEKLLEIATGARTTRVQAYTALAKLRLAALATHPTPSWAQPAAPLMAALSLPDPPADVFELLGVIFMRNPRMDARELEIIEEGVRRHPESVELLYILAFLRAKAGKEQGAIELVNRALSCNPKPEIEQRLKKLRKSLNALRSSTTGK